MIKLPKPIHGFIIEDMKNQVIQSGSHIFCGHCGGKIGRMKNSLKFPFRWNELEKSLEDTSIFVTRAYVKHVPCDHAISFNGANIRFTALDKYREWFNEEK